MPFCNLFMERLSYLCFNESVHCVDPLLVFIIIDFNISRAVKSTHHYR